MLIPRLILLLTLLALQMAPLYAQGQGKNREVAHVIHVSIDALGGKYLEKFLRESPKEFGNFKRLVDEGASTMNARTDYFRTTTLQNHTSMVTSRPVLTTEGFDIYKGHYWLHNGTPKKEETLHDQNPEGGYTSSTFDVVHDSGLSTALYSTKPKFVIYSQTYGLKNGPEKVDTRGKVGRALVGGDIHAATIEELKKYKPTYTFLHYGDPDAAGHKYGYLGKEYRDAVKTVDGYLGDYLKIIDSDPEWKDRTVIILTADHGGQPGTKGHGNANHSYNYTIPFIVWGKGVARGVDLYEINEGVRTNPGDDRTEYGRTDQPIRNGDSGNLALKLLGLPSIPGSLINHRQDLKVR